MPAVWAVVVAAGTGERFGRHKQFALLDGVPVAARAVTACRSVAGAVVLVAPAGCDDSYGADVVVTGGATRSASVRAGLAAVGPEAEVVVVHDAARPLAPPESFAAVVGALADGRADGAICALAVADTLKRVAPPLGPGSASLVRSTLERADLVAVQTPQAFVADVLRRAHADGGEATDDAALVEALGATVRVVPGDPRNLKLTSPADLVVAESLLRA
ncbi:MAG TPA: 2-C-methyl-D-erythritol 4-phosphate cytidylyltransferase [Acidimicrobiales bacterium]|nr:2-C-methyl-D-erythritol 4-phosphate cytidylyltransferase [Acidimicrobiales bacterium]